MENVCNDCKSILDANGGSLICTPAIGYCKACGIEVPYRNIQYCEQCSQGLNLCRCCFKDLVDPDQEFCRCMVDAKGHLTIPGTCNDCSAETHWNGRYCLTCAKARGVCESCGKKPKAKSIV